MATVETTAVEPKAAPTSADNARSTAGLCAHCGLPCGELHFCCLGCELAQQLAREADAGEQRTSSVLMVAAFLSICVMMLSLFLYAEDIYDVASSDGLLWLRQGYRVAAGTLSTPVMWMLGRPLLKRAFRALKSRRISIELLIAVGAFAAYGLSWKAVWLHGGDVYFDTACAALLLSTVGRSLEARVRRRAAGLIAPLLGNVGLVQVRAGWSESSMTLRPPVEIEADMVVEVPPETASPVDVVALAPGEVDLQAIVGEPWPTAVAAGEVVLAGAVPHGVALRGRALCRMHDSTLRQLEALTRRTRGQRGGVTKLADRLARVLIWLVLSVAAGSFCYWFFYVNAATAVNNGLAVLLVACPCTYGVLVPLLQWRALRLALSEKQVCIRNVTALDRLASIGAVVFDKTGTLTEPMQQVTVGYASGVDERQLWRTVLALERDVRHPLGRALATVAQRRLGSDADGVQPLAERRQLPALGVVGKNDRGEVVALGSLALMRQQRVHDASLPRVIDNAPAGSDVFLAIGSRVVARLRVSERLRSEARAAIAALRANGVSLSIASGDDTARVAEVGRLLGIAAVGQLLPAAKRQHLLQNKRTAFVGDGINDVPVMAAADVSIAFGNDASALACGVADVVVLTPDLTTLPWLLSLAKRTLRTARRALAVSTAYNALFVAMAAVGWLRPIWAGVSMLLSSLITLAAVMHGSRTIATSVNGGNSDAGAASEAPSACEVAA